MRVIRRIAGNESFILCGRGDPPHSTMIERPRRTSWISAFHAAFSGLGYALRTQPNMRVHVFAAVAVAVAGVLLQLSPTEWGLIVLCIGLMWSTELLNTAVEVIVDDLSPEYRDHARIAKDLAAGAVLSSAIASAAVGLIVFLPKILALVTASHTTSAA